MTSEMPETPPDQGDVATKPFYKRWWFIAIVAIVGIGLIGSVLGEDSEEPVAAADTTTTSSIADTTTTVEAETTTTAAAPTTTTSAPTTTTSTTTSTTTTTTVPAGPEQAFGSGMQVVGEDVVPGIYETGQLGEGIFDGCYWERLAGFSGEFDDIIANNNATGHDVVEIAASDAAFDSNCDAWYELTPLDELMTTIPHGKWVVGVHIEAGAYQAEGGNSCYWERLSGVSGEFDDIIANGLPSGSVIVEVASSDFAFYSGGCGDWARRD